MRELLRKPIPVLLMSLAAIWVVYSNVIKPIQQKSLLHAPAMFVQSLKTADTPTISSDTRDLTWNQKHLRNPFEPNKSRGSVSRTSQKSHDVLSAILFGTKEPLAMINGQLFSQGDKISNQTVLSIKPDYVILKGSKGQKKLTLSKSPRG